MDKGKMQEEIKNEDVISNLRELLKEDVSKILICLAGIISNTILEHIVNPELKRRFARDKLPLIIQILFKEIVKDKLEVEFRFDYDARGDVIIERKWEHLSVPLMHSLLSENRMPRKILVGERNLVAYITWVRITEHEYHAYPQIDRLVKHLLDKPPKICPVCGRAFIAQRRDKIYCTRNCLDAAAKRRQRKKREEISCPP